MSARIEISLDETLGTISPDVYGYLLENLGTVIYDGVWVGEDAKIPHIGGIRQALVERLREIKPSVIRWPGGNFADYYDWKDGIGPRAARPRRTNMWCNEMPPGSGPQHYDPNHFGTPEFMQLCRLSGARPFLNANVRSLPAQEFTRWVEYCNSPDGSTTLAEQRKADGSPEPHGVRYWGIGNEVWAAGGDLTVEEYATLYKRFTAGIPQYGLDLAFIPSGGPPPVSNNEWVREFLRICSKGIIPIPIAAMSVHYYATSPLENLRPGQIPADVVRNWQAFLPDALEFDPFDWYDYLARSARMDSMIAACWAAMEEFDPQRRIKIAVDEWGAFCHPRTALSPLNITGRAVTLRDALSVAVTLDSFHRHADKLLLANFTGLINQEGGLFRAEGEKLVATPIYHVFALYAAHQSGQAVKTVFEAPSIRHEQNGRSVSLWGLSGSASVRDRELTLTVVNPHVSEPADAAIAIRGGEVISGTVATLTHEDIHAQNTFADPEQVKPVVRSLEVNGSAFQHRFPPASVSAVTLRLKGG